MLKNYLILLTLGILWGSSFILMKRGLEVFSADQIAALRILLSSLTLLPFAIQRLRRIPWKRTGLIFISGIVGSGIPAFMFPLAQTRIDSSLAGILNSLTPLFTLVLGVLLFRLIVSRENVIGVSLGFLGALILIFPGMSIEDPGHTGFALLALIGSFCYAVNTNLLKAFLGGITPLTIASGSFLFMGPPSAIYLSTTGFHELIAEGSAFWEALFYVAVLAVVGTALALILFNRLLQNTHPVFASSVTFIIPVVAVFWGLLDGEALMLSDYAGMMLILSGLYLTRK